MSNVVFKDLPECTCICKSEKQNTTNLIELFEKVMKQNYQNSLDIVKLSNKINKNMLGDIYNDLEYHLFKSKLRNKIKDYFVDGKVDKDLTYEKIFNFVRYNFKLTYTETVDVLDEFKIEFYSLKVYEVENVLNILVKNLELDENKIILESSKDMKQFVFELNKKQNILINNYTNITVYITKKFRVDFRWFEDSFERYFTIYQKDDRKTFWVNVQTASPNSVFKEVSTDVSTLKILFGKSEVLITVNSDFVCSIPLVIPVKLYYIGTENAYVETFEVENVWDYQLLNK